MRHKFFWRAHYNDQTHLDEYDDENQDGRGFAEVDKDRLVAFELIPTDEISALPRPLVVVSEGIRPIFFRRHKVELDPNTNSEQKRVVIHCLGWQKTIDGHNVKSFTFFFDDGSCIVSDNDNIV